MTKLSGVALAVSLLVLCLCSSSVLATYDCLYEARHCNGNKFSALVKADTALQAVFKSNDFAGTCLIPSDAAFDKLKLDGSQSIRDILLYHAIDKVVYKKDLVSSSPLQTLFKPNKLTCTAVGKSITITGARNSATLVKGDYKTIKGVAHCIDTVLLPPGPEPGPKPVTKPRPVYKPKPAPKPVYKPKPAPKPVYKPKPAPKPAPSPVYAADPSPAPSPVYQCTTAWDYIQSRPDLSIFAELIQKTDQVDLLSSIQAYGTVFLPVNKAFKAFARDRGVSVYDLGEDCNLKDLITNHISTTERLFAFQKPGRRLQAGGVGQDIYGSARANSAVNTQTQGVIARPRFSIPSFGGRGGGGAFGRRLAGYEPTPTYTSSPARNEFSLWAAWSTASIIEPDISACNMIMHTINNALAPSSWGAPLSNAIPLYDKNIDSSDTFQDAYSALQGYTITSLAFEIYNSTSIRSSLLDVTSKYTWVMLTNEAFVKDIPALRPYLDDPNKLAELVKTQVVSTEPLTVASMNDGDTLQSLQGTTATVAKPGNDGVEVTLEGQTTECNLVATDITAGQGFAHIGDTILFPY